MSGEWLNEDGAVFPDSLQQTPPMPPPGMVPPQITSFTPQGQPIYAPTQWYQPPQASADFIPAQNGPPSIHYPTYPVLAKLDSPPMPADVSTTEEVHDHYLQQTLIWHQNKQIYVPYDTNDTIPPLSLEDEANGLKYYFHVEIRYAMSQVRRVDGGVMPAKIGNPITYLTKFSEPLTKYCKLLVGNGFYDQGGAPECPVRLFFPHLAEMKTMLNKAETLLASESATKDEKNQLARSLGIMPPVNGQMLANGMNPPVQEARAPIVKSRKRRRAPIVNSRGSRAPDLVLSEEEFMAAIVDATAHLRVLIKCIERFFQPVSERLNMLVGNGHIEFELLYYFFEPGQILTYKTFGGELHAFRVSQRDYSNSGLQTHHALQAYDGVQAGNLFTVTGTKYCWNGFQYQALPITQTMNYFPGTRDISSLNFQHMSEAEKLFLTERGKRYMEYSGRPQHRLYRDSRVMIDQVSYAIKYPSAAMPFGSPPGGINYQPTGTNFGAPYPAAPYPGTPPPLPYMPPGMDMDQFKPVSTITEDDENIVMLPAEVNGFSLKIKDWGSFPVDQLRPVAFNDDAWEHLVLDADTKVLIKGLVDVTNMSNMSDTIIDDVIPGKGGGLIALLHGPPGTGKTLTAEAVAEHLKRPLYIAGASELSTDAASLESRLRDIVDLATKWDAVLLIDEADVFLEQRSLHEIARNSLVSVALRVLEYHRGVLFLTTNRIQTFDSAFLSRFSIAIKYPELDEPGRLQVWSNFLELAGCTLVSEVNAKELANCNVPLLRSSIETLAKKELNGRTIKNVVRTAQALALSANKPLSIDHINVVLAVQEKFIQDFSGMKM
ncbi:hypothetical protein C8J56DRAFT_1165743 [Mycena floridula]|nr:hypothetical protein C8J56DRAFT_1165743 [Mycena floridula]